jgi:hypothetical protein
MNKSNRPQPRNTEAYAEFFGKLLKAVEQGKAKAQQEKLQRRVDKKNKNAEQERLIESGYASLEEKALSFNLDNKELETFLVQNLKTLSNEQHKMLTLIEKRIWCYNYNIYKAMAKGFKVMPLQHLSILGKLFLIGLTSYLIYFIFFSSFYVFINALLAMYAIVPTLLFTPLIGKHFIDPETLVFAARSYLIFNPNSIYLPELRLLFVELDKMGLSPRLKISIDYQRPPLGVFLEVALTISPNWRSLSKSFS